MHHPPSGEKHLGGIWEQGGLTRLGGFFWAFSPAPDVSMQVGHKTPVKTLETVFADLEEGEKERERERVRGSKMVTVVHLPEMERNRETARDK